MRILLAHNRYREPGGEDGVFENERALLEAAGQEVVVYERHNDEINPNSLLQLVDYSRRTVWATDSVREIRKLLRCVRPDVAHFHNTFPLISPAAYYACAAEHVPVVQTLSNYRLFCPGGVFLRHNQPCELCLNTLTAWPGVRHRCYRGSLAGTAVVAAMLGVHRALGTWKRRVDAFVALSEFSRRKFIAGGLPPNKITVKPNFVYPDPGPRNQESDYALYVGRLSKEKGVFTLLAAWKELSTTPLVIAGDGPLIGAVRDIVERDFADRVTLVGWRSRSEILELVRGAKFLVVPSICYENFPLSIAEAFSCGVPVVGSNLGGIGELVQHNSSGMVFNPGDSSELAATASMLAEDASFRRRLGAGARAQFLSYYTAEKNLETLLGIYKRVRRP